MDKKVNTSRSYKFWLSTMLYLRSPELILLITGSCILWSTSSHLSHLPPWPLATTNLLYDSVSWIFLDSIHKWYHTVLVFWCLTSFFYVCVCVCVRVCVCVCVCVFKVTTLAYESSQARDRTGAIAAGLHHNYSNTRSEPCLCPTPQLMATPDP